MKKEILRGFAKVARDATDQKKAEEALRRARDELEKKVVERTEDLIATNEALQRAIVQRQELETELLEISEREKRRIGEDLHDVVCQELAGAALLLKTASNRFANKNPAASKSLDEAAHVVNHSVNVARRSGAPFSAG